MEPRFTTPIERATQAEKAQAWNQLMKYVNEGGGDPVFRAYNWLTSQVTTREEAPPRTGSGNADPAQTKRALMRSAMVAYKMELVETLRTADGNNREQAKASLIEFNAAMRVMWMNY